MTDPSIFMNARWNTYSHLPVVDNSELIVQTCNECPSCNTTQSSTYSKKNVVHMGQPTWTRCTTFDIGVKDCLKHAYCRLCNVHF